MVLSIREIKAQEVVVTILLEGEKFDLGTWWYFWF
jgi:hypothetical protein